MPVGTANVIVNSTVTGGFASLPNGTVYSIKLTGPSCVSGSTLTINPAASGTLTFPNLFPGGYAAIEDTSGFSSKFSGTTSGSCTVVDGGVASIQINNVYTPSSSINVNVTSSVNGSGVIPASTTFSISLTGPSFTTGTTQILPSTGGTATFTNILPGQYTISEGNPGAGFSINSSPQTLTVQDGGVGNINISNSYTTPPGTLNVNVVNIATGAPIPNSTVFYISLIGPAFPTGTEPGATGTCGVNGGVLSFPNLPAGNYTVTQLNPGVGFSVAGSGVVTNIIGGDVKNTTITNTYTTYSVKGAIEIWFPNYALDVPLYIKNISSGQMFYQYLTNPYPGSDPTGDPHSYYDFNFQGFPNGSYEVGINSPMYLPGYIPKNSGGSPGGAIVVNVNGSDNVNNFTNYTLSYAKGSSGPYHIELRLENNDGTLLYNVPFSCSYTFSTKHGLKGGVSYSYYSITSTEPVYQSSFSIPTGNTNAVQNISVTTSTSFTFTIPPPITYFGDGCIIELRKNN